MKRFDVDGDGTVDFDEFKQLLAKLMARRSPLPPTVSAWMSIPR